MSDVSAADCERITIVGLGLIGASFALALKKSGFAGSITGVVRTARTGQRALELGAVDKIATSTADGVKDADVVLLAVPMLSMRAQLEAMRGKLPVGAIITDAGSVKGCFVDDARAVFGSLKRIVPGHPIAGREKSGVDAADPQLFTGRRVLLTPVEETEQSAIATVTHLWQLAGAEVECLSPEHHDRILAATSHLPHVLAFAMVDTLATHQQAEEIFRYAAGGFRDFTRIASSDAVMWRDVCLTNRRAVCNSIDALSEHLDRLRAAIEAGDGDIIEKTFLRAREARDTHVIKP